MPKSKFCTIGTIRSGSTTNKNMTNVLVIIRRKAQEVFTKMNDKNCVTKVEIFVEVKSYFIYFILDSPEKGQTM